VIEWEVLEDQRQIGTPCGEELQVQVLRKDAGAEFSGCNPRSTRVDVLQMREHEAMLESI
jgi:hypothetical protein